MTNEEKKAWLNRYRLAGLEVQRLQEEIDRWEAQATALTARYDGDSRRGSDDPLQRAVEEMLLLRKELGEQLQKQIALRREIEGAIAGVRDERLRELLHLRYLEGLTWEKITERWKLDIRWVFRLHERALEKLTIESQYQTVV